MFHLVEQQRAVCRKHGVPWVESGEAMRFGIARNVRGGPERTRMVAQATGTRGNDGAPTVTVTGQRSISALKLASEPLFCRVTSAWRRPPNCKGAPIDWRKVDLHGSGWISRVCAEYEIGDTRLPSAKYKIKILERADGFLTLPNVAVKSHEGVSNWIAGLGRTELEALQDAIARMGEQFAKYGEEELEWSDPLDF